MDSFTQKIVNSKKYNPNENSGFVNKLLVTLDGVSETYYLNNGDYNIGRNDDCDIQILRHTVSRYHALIRVEADGVAFVKDNGSVNATYRNGTKLQKDAMYELISGTEITFGDVVCKYIFESDESQSPDSCNKRDNIKSPLKITIHRVDSDSLFSDNSVNLSEDYGSENGETIVSLNIDETKEIISHNLSPIKAVNVRCNAISELENTLENMEGIMDSEEDTALDDTVILDRSKIASPIQDDTADNGAQLKEFEIEFGLQDTDIFYCSVDSVKETNKKNYFADSLEESSEKKKVHYNFDDDDIFHCSEDSTNERNSEHQAKDTAISSQIKTIQSDLEHSEYVGNHCKSDLELLGSVTDTDDNSDIFHFEEDFASEKNDQQNNSDRLETIKNDTENIFDDSDIFKCTDEDSDEVMIPLKSDENRPKPDNTTSNESQVYGSKDNVVDNLEDTDILEISEINENEEGEKTLITLDEVLEELMQDSEVAKDNEDHSWMDLQFSEEKKKEDLVDLEDNITTLKVEGIINVGHNKYGMEATDIDANSESSNPIIQVKECLIKIEKMDVELCQSADIKDEERLNILIKDEQIVSKTSSKFDHSMIFRQPFVVVNKMVNDDDRDFIDRLNSETNVEDTLTQRLSNNRFIDLRYDTPGSIYDQATQPIDESESSIIIDTQVVKDDSVNYESYDLSSQPTTQVVQDDASSLSHNSEVCTQVLCDSIANDSHSCGDNGGSGTQVVQDVAASLSQNTEVCTQVLCDNIANDSHICSDNRGSQTNVVHDLDLDNGNSLELSKTTTQNEISSQRVNKLISSMFPFATIDHENSFGKSSKTAISLSLKKEFDKTTQIILPAPGLDHVNKVRFGNKSPMDKINRDTNIDIRVTVKKSNNKAKKEPKPSTRNKANIIKTKDKKSEKVTYQPEPIVKGRNVRANKKIVQSLKTMTTRSSKPGATKKLINVDEVNLQMFDVENMSPSKAVYIFSEKNEANITINTSRRKNLPITFDKDNEAKKKLRSSDSFLAKETTGGTQKEKKMKRKVDFSKSLDSDTGPTQSRMLKASKPVQLKSSTKKEKETVSIKRKSDLPDDNPMLTRKRKAVDITLDQSLDDDSLQLLLNSKTIKLDMSLTPNNNDNACVMIERTRQSRRSSLRSMATDSPTISGRCKNVIMFSGSHDVKYENIVRRLGGEITTDAGHATHLVMNKMRRTVKVLCCVARGINIVTTEWLVACHSLTYFIPTGSYVLKNDCDKFNIDLQMILERARRSQKLCNGILGHYRYVVFVAANTKPSPTELEQIISYAGGTFVPISDKQFDEYLNEVNVRHICIATEMDLNTRNREINSRITSLVERDVDIVSVEFLFAMIMEQKHPAVKNYKIYNA